MSQLYQCDIGDCSYETESERGLSIHQTRAHDKSGSSKKTYTCAECGDTFKDYASRREGRGRETFFCGRDCKHAYESDDVVERTCANCGELLQLPEHRLKDSADGYSIDNHFCDKECESEWKGSNWVGENHPTWDGGLEEAVCEECGDPFFAKPAKIKNEGTARFCSRDCANENQTVDRVELTCTICGETFMREPWMVRTDQSVCSEECTRELLSQIRQGEKNPAWAGGAFPYGAGFGEEKKEKVRKRQGRQCAECGDGPEENGRRLSVHHIQKARSFDDDEARNNDDNLVALCTGCHKKWEKMSPLRPMTVERVGE